MRVAREFRDMIGQLEKRGYRVVRGKKHGRLVDADGHFISSVPKNDSCPRAAKNWRSQLRQKGIPID